MNRPNVSVIIVNWNGANYLETCLVSLARQQRCRLEILVVDNASTDRSSEVVASFQAQHPTVPVRFIRNAKNEGFCWANNQGIQASSGEFVLLLNADVTLQPQFIAKLLQVMRNDRKVGIATGKLLNGHDPQKIDSTGIMIYKNRRAVDRGQQEADDGRYSTEEEVFGASGAACLCRRTMLEALKYSRKELVELQLPGEAHDEYLDELFFAYKEDVDLAWRAQLAGWKCVYTPEAVGYHFRKWGVGKRHEIPKWVRRQSLKNRYVMLLKNEQLRTLLPSLLPIIWHEFLSFGYMLIREPYLFAVVHDLMRLWPAIKQKRRLTQQRVSPSESSARLLRWFY